jgi:serine/threonine-protein kinase TNNI3K
VLKLVSDPRTLQGNVLIDDEEHAQLADFGLAFVTDATLGTTSTKRSGSSRWMAPELLDPQVKFKRTYASDIYAFACLCIEVIIPGYLGVLQLILSKQIYTGEQPFWNLRQDITVVLEVLKQMRPPRPSITGPPDGTRAMSDRLWATVEACWAHNPSDRPDMCEVSGLIMSL